MREDFISVVIPAFNEEARIVSTLKKIWDYLNEHFHKFEIIVVNDGSTDRTVPELEALSETMGNMKIVHNDKNMGKGYSVKRGVLAASGDVILISDSDLSTPIEEAEKLFEWLHRGFDIAIGSRGLKDSHIVIRQPWYREKMGKIFNILVRAIIIGGIKDTQCGFKLFRSDVANQIFLRSLIKGFSFDIEILFLANKSGFRIKEVPMRWINSPHSKVRILKDSLLMFTDLLRVKLNHLLGIYKEKAG